MLDLKTGNLSILTHGTGAPTKCAQTHSRIQARQRDISGMTHAFRNRLGMLLAMICFPHFPWHACIFQALGEISGQENVGPIRRAPLQSKAALSRVVGRNFRATLRSL